MPTVYTYKQNVCKTMDESKRGAIHFKLSFVICQQYTFINKMYARRWMKAKGLKVLL